jgi:hypothetical protein
MSSENFAAGYLAGMTDLSNPAGQWDPEEMQRKLLLTVRFGVYPLGDFVFTRDEGSNNVNIKLKEDAPQSIQVGRQKFEKVKRFTSSGVIDAAENEKRKTKSPGFRSLTHIWPAMLCTIKVTTAYGAKPTGEELNPTHNNTEPLPFPIFEGPLPIPFGGRS